MLNLATKDIYKMLMGAILSEVNDFGKTQAEEPQSVIPEVSKLQSSVPYPAEQYNIINKDKAIKDIKVISYKDFKEV